MTAYLNIRRSRASTTILFGVFLIFVIFATRTADAATFFVQYPNQVIHAGEVFEVSVMMDAEGNSINAVEGAITYTENLALRDIIDGVSFVPLWVKRPKLDIGNISFAGIIPGGYNGDIGPYWKGFRAGTLMRLRFEAKKSGPARLHIVVDNLLLNDGKGTAIKPKIQNMDMYISDGFARSGVIADTKSKADIAPPESFKPVVIQDKNIFDGKYALIFETQDKDSGVYYYQVREGNSDFILAESPYLLSDQTLRSAVEVKAVDRAGNIRIEKVFGTYLLFSLQKSIIWFILIGIGFLFLRFVFRKLF